MLSNNQQQWLKNAEKILQSHTDSGGKYLMCAIAVKGNRLYGVEFNEYPDHRAGESMHEAYEGIGCHAEMKLLMLNECANTIVYVVGRRNRPVDSSKPCKRCTQLIKNSKIKRIIYVENAVAISKLPEEL